MNIYRKIIKLNYLFTLLVIDLDLVAIIIVIKNNAVVMTNMLDGNSGITWIGMSMPASVLLIFSILKI